jgi:hydroxyquinol 1,2-dioxygenase
MARSWTKYPYFEEDTSGDVVIARMGADIDPRLRQVMTSAIKHLHAFVKEVRPNHEEWLEAIKFLTATGHMSTDWRQEYILLSDTLGVTMLVDAINHSHGDLATENTILGPFYVENPPRLPNGANICLDGKGEPLFVQGRVLDTAGNPISGATVDAWQTNEDGFYDVQQKGVQPEMNLRGIFTTDDQGRFSFHSVKPRFYPIPDDGPVGQLLRAMGRGPNRAAHIHFKVKAPGYEEVITHVFPPDCPYLETDAVFGVKESLIGDFRKVDGGWALDWDFMLAAEG